MNKKGNAMFFSVFAIVAVLAIGGYLIFGNGGSDTLSIGGDGGSGERALCTTETTPDVTIKAYDAENVGTALTEATNLYRKKGAISWSSWTQGTAITGLEGDEVYEFVIGISTTDFTDNAYGEMFEHKVLCQETETIEKAVYNDEVETSLSATFYNADGDAGAETYVAGQSQTVSMKLAAGTDEVFGNPFLGDEYPNVVCLDLNSTEWDKPEKVTFDGKTMASVSIPQRHTSATGANTYCYKAPVVDDSIMENDRYLLRLNADDSTAPATDATATIYAANWYVNAETGDVEFGIENEEGTAVGTDAADTLALDFTA